MSAIVGSTFETHEPFPRRVLVKIGEGTIKLPKRHTRADLDEFVACYRPGDRHNRAATWTPENPAGRWRPYTCDEIIQRDKASLDIFWLRDESLEDSANLPAPDVLAAEIIEDLQAALEELAAIQSELSRGAG